MHAHSKASHHSLEVHFRVSDDADAVRITAVLEALGFHVVRDLDDVDGGARLRWAVDRLSRLHHLTEREREVLAGVLEGHDNERLASKLDISRATVKWHLHNVFAKTGVASREALLRVALELGPREGGTASAVQGCAQKASRPSDWAGPHDVTTKIE